MQRVARLCSFVFLALLLSACAQLQSTRYVEQAHDPSVGDVLELSQALSVPTGSSKAWFDPLFYQTQSLSVAGILGPNRQRNGLKCGFDLHRPVVSDRSETVIASDEFVVTGVSRLSDPYGVDPATVSSHDGFDSDVTLTYRIGVSSAEQPQVVAIFCSQRYALLDRGTNYPDALQLREQAGQKLVWP